MIITSTPMRISLFGGSTDHPNFIKKYKKSIIISFTANLKTYVCLSRDKYGFNNHDHSYLINYSKREVRKNISDIKNDIVRSVFTFYKMPPCSVYLTSDIYSYGNGLASSSAYLVSLIKACEQFTNNNRNTYEISKLALELERKFNPYCGFQDPFGCAYSGLKSIKTNNDIDFDIKTYQQDIFKLYDFYLYPTGLSRQSIKILHNLSSSYKKILPLYETACRANDFLKKKDYNSFIHLIKESWNLKKNTSPLIMQNKKIKNLDSFLSQHKSIIAHKILGAGNGGFFLIITKKNQLLEKEMIDKIIPLL